MRYPPARPPRLGIDQLGQVAKENGNADPGPYEPAPAGLPTTAAPDDLPTYRAGMAQVVHSLAADERGTLLRENAWPPLAAAVVAMDGHWPAAWELADTAPTDNAAIYAAVAWLAEQSAAELHGLPRIPIWDVGVGLVCRAARLGVFGTQWPGGEVISKLNLWWWDIRDEESLKTVFGYSAEELRTPGNYAIWAAMRLCEYQEFGLEPGGPLALMAEGERLIPPYAANAPFCTAFLTTQFDMPS